MQEQYIMQCIYKSLIQYSGSYNYAQLYDNFDEFFDNFDLNRNSGKTSLLLVPPLKKYRSFTIYYLRTPVKPSTTEKNWLTADTEFSLERFIVSKTSRS